MEFLSIWQNRQTNIKNWPISFVTIVYLNCRISNTNITSNASMGYMNMMMGVGGGVNVSGEGQRGRCVFVAFI